MSQKWFGFANVQLEDRDMLQIFNMSKDASNLWRTLMLECQAGYKLSIKYVERSGQWWFTLTGSEISGNDGLSLSSSGETEELAMASLVYKHRNITDSHWPHPQNPDDRRKAS